MSLKPHGESPGRCSWTVLAASNGVQFGGFGKPAASRGAYVGS